MKLLSIDGGGALGVGPTLLMMLLAEEYDFEIDALTGSSIGAAIVAMYALGYSKRDVNAMLVKMLGSIFATPGFFWRIDPTHPKYDCQALDKALLEAFGDKRMSDLLKPVWITSADFARGRPKIWDNTDNALVRDVVRKSVAAPTYFSPVASRYCDGGLVANNPVMIGIGGCIALGHELRDISALSLNTGGEFWKDPKVGARMLALQWASPVIKFCLDGCEERDAFTATQLLGNRHLRLIPFQDHDVDMDDLSSLDYWRAQWKTVYENNKVSIAHNLNAQVKNV